ncbi:MAG: protein-glutamate O-methyltransferase CheR [Magnetospirillum sp.]|nr:protein-glutamate O-methyltransferase CheR [Magnetospirillum sp.]
MIAPRIDPGQREFAGPAAEAADLAFFAGAMRARAGIVLPESKAALIYRRLAPRVRELGLADFASYRARLSDPADPEWDAIVAALTTNHSRFFREIHHFRLLDRHLAAMLRAGAKRIRFWSAGCAAGQEPYSMAMLLARADVAAAGVDARVLATDIDPTALAAAEAAVYPRDDVGHLPRFARAYLRAGTDGKWTLAGPPREMVRFKRHNLVGDVWPMKGPFDAIFCRNMLIYLSPEDQARVVARLVGYLRPRGILCLGHSETARDPALPIDRLDVPSAYVRH